MSQTAIIEDLLARVRRLEDQMANAPARTLAGDKPRRAPNMTDRWLTNVRFEPKPDGKCASARCKTKIAVGSRAWYTPADKKLYCEPCGTAMGAPVA